MRRVLHLRSSGGLLGAEQVVLALCEHSQACGYEGIVCVTRDRGEPVPALFDEAAKRGIRGHVLECRRALDFGAISRLRDLVRAESIDLIHCHGYREDFYAALARADCRIVATNHLWKRTTPALRFYAWLDARLMRRFDRVVAVSREIDREHAAIGLDPSRCAYIPNGVDLERFSGAAPDESARAALKAELGIAAGGIVLIAVGSLTEEKGHRFLLEAVAAATSRQLGLVIVGDGPLANELGDTSRRLGVAERVAFPGRRSDVAEWLSRADVFVLPSLSEGLPIALLEAMASGAAVIASDVGDVGSVIRDGVSGLLVPAGDAAALAAAIDRLAGDAPLRRQLALTGADVVRKSFSAESMTAAYCRLYDDLFDGG